MNSNLQIFKNTEFGEIEILVHNNKFYFQAIVCAKMLGYKNPYDAIKRHTKDCVKHELLTVGGNQQVIFISESDLYRLITKSKLETAIKFEEWIFETVLPSIRKNDLYVEDNLLDEMLREPEIIAKLLLELKSERDKNKKVIEQLNFKSQYLDLILSSENLIPITLIAKEYGKSAALFNKFLHKIKVQYKVSGVWVLYQRYARHGYVRGVTTFENEKVTSTHTYWTEKGKQFLYNLLKTKHNMLPLAELEVVDENK